MMDVRQMLIAIGNSRVQTHNLGADILAVFESVLPGGLMLHTDCTGAELLGVYDILPPTARETIAAAIPRTVASPSTEPQLISTMLRIATILCLMSAIILMVIAGLVNMGRFDKRELTPIGVLIDGVSRLTDPEETDSK